MNLRRAAGLLLLAVAAAGCGCPCHAQTGPDTSWTASTEDPQCATLRLQSSMAAGQRLLDMMQGTTDAPDTRQLDATIGLLCQRRRDGSR